MKPDTHFWDILDKLVSQAEIQIDRPKGSVHPRYPECIYPFDYGYLTNTTSGDGDGIDIWIGSLSDQTPTGIVCTFDLRKRDAEIKILMGCTPEDMQIIQDFHTGSNTAAKLILRHES